MRLLIIVNRDGQFGNRLHTFANAIALGMEYGLTVINLSFREYRSYFPSTDGKSFPKWPWSEGGVTNSLIVLDRLADDLFRLFYSKKWMKRLRAIPRVGEIPDVSIISCVDESLSKTLREDRLIVCKAWDLWLKELTRKYRDRICRFFRPQQFRQDKIHRILTTVRMTHNPIIGVHVRRGDYKTYLDGRYFYEMAAYIRVMRHAMELFPDANPCFLICSNEQMAENWFEGLKVRVLNGDEADDIFSLAACDYIVGPPSTFSHWASYYGGVPRYEIGDPDRRFSREDFSVCESC